MEYHTGIQVNKDIVTQVTHDTLQRLPLTPICRNIHIAKRKPAQKPLATIWQELKIRQM